MSACQDGPESENLSQQPGLSYLGVDGKPHPVVAAGAMAAGSRAPPKKPASAIWRRDVAPWDD